MSILLTVVLALFVFSSVVFAETYVNDIDFHSSSGSSLGTGTIISYDIGEAAGQEVEISYKYIYLSNTGGANAYVYTKLNGKTIDTNEFDIPRVCTDTTCGGGGNDKTERNDKNNYVTHTFTTTIPDNLMLYELKFDYKNGNYRVMITDVKVKTAGESECYEGETIDEVCWDGSEVTTKICQDGKWIDLPDLCPEEVSECENGEQNVVTCDDGEEIVIEVCVDNQWFETGLHCEEDEKECPVDIIARSHEDVYYPGDEMRFYGTIIYEEGQKEETINLVIKQPDDTTVIVAVDTNGYGDFEYAEELEDYAPLGEWSVTARINDPIEECGEYEGATDTFEVLDERVCAAKIDLSFNQETYKAGDTWEITITAEDANGDPIPYLELEVWSDVEGSGTTTQQLDSDGKYTASSTLGKIPTEIEGTWTWKISTIGDCELLTDSETATFVAGGGPSCNYNGNCESGESSTCDDCFVCGDNDKRCSGIDLQVCEDSKWRTIQVCGGFCDSNMLRCAGESGQAQICTDSDGGSMFDIKGITYGRDQFTGEYVTKTDDCHDTSLVEYFCVGYDVFHATSVCKYGCKEGACVSAQEEMAEDIKETKGILERLLDFLISVFGGGDEGGYELEDEGIAVFTDDTKIHLADSLGKQGLNNVLTEKDLPSLLAGGNVNDGASSSKLYSQTIKFGKFDGPVYQLQFEKPGSDSSVDPTYSFGRFPTTATASDYFYMTEVTFFGGIDDVSETEKIVLFGKRYIIDDIDATGPNPTIVLEEVYNGNILTLENAHKVQTGTDKRSIDGTLIEVEVEDGRLTSFKVYIAGKSSTDDHLKLGDQYIDPVWDTFAVFFDSMDVDPRTDVDNELEITPQGDNLITLTMTDYDGNVETLEWARKPYSSSENFILQDDNTYDWIVMEGEIAQSFWYLVLDADSTNGGIYQLSSVSGLKGGQATDSFKYENVFARSSTEVVTGSQGRVAAVIDGGMYNVEVKTSTKLSFTWGKGSGFGDYGEYLTIYPKIKGQDGYEIAFTRPHVNFTVVDQMRIQLPTGAISLGRIMDTVTIASSVQEDGSDSLFHDLKCYDSEGDLTVNFDISNYGSYCTFYLGAQSGSEKAVGYIVESEGTGENVLLSLYGYTENNEWGELNPAVMIFEEKNSDLEKHTIIIEAGVESKGSDYIASVRTPVFSSENDNSVLASDSNIIDHVDQYGTYIMYDTTAQNYMRIYYPDEQVSANVYVVTLPETTSSSTGGVIMYSIDGCPFCSIAKRFFDENGVEYTVYEVDENLAAKQEMIEKSGQTGVPVIDIDGEVIVGFKEDEISGLLGIPR